MNLVDEDGRAIMPGIELPADVVFPNDGNFLSRNFIINIQHLKFEKAGHYAIDIANDAGTPVVAADHGPGPGRKKNQAISLRRR
jgi:hypothetical protein